MTKLTDRNEKIINQLKEKSFYILLKNKINEILFDQFLFSIYLNDKIINYLGKNLL